jgi:hypothetical protein
MNMGNFHGFVTDLAMKMSDILSLICAAGFCGRIDGACCALHCRFKPAT